MTRRNMPSESAADIEIIGADANNLRCVDVRIPMGRVTMVVGVSGSGKSSLLEDTLATEAARRMRTFLGIQQPQLERPPPGAFIGAMPATVHVGQRAFRASSRTTVATATGLLGTLRRLFLADARPYSEELRRYIQEPSPERYADWLVRHYRGPLSIWAVPVRFAATDGMRAVEHLREVGVEQVTVRSETDTPAVWERGRVVRLEKFKPLKPTVRHIIEAQVGVATLGSKPDHAKLLALLQRAFDAGRGAVVVDLPEAQQPELRGPFGPRLDSKTHHVEPELATCFFPPNSHLLSFNAPEHPESGACPMCLGTGRAVTLQESALVIDPSRSMHEGAFSLWTEKNYKYVNIQHETIEGLRGLRGFSPDVPWKKLSPDARRLVLEGSGGELVVDKEPKTGRKMSAGRPFEGFRHAILERISRGTKVSQSLSTLVSEGPCPACEGSRWSFQARALRVGDTGIHELLRRPFMELMDFTKREGSFARAVSAEARRWVDLIHHHSRAFVSVGLGHLSGERGMQEVSEGEGRRARLAGLLNVRSTGLCLLLDEPARGLHEQDLTGLTESISSLAPAHTVVMNEHRQALVEAADHLIQLGEGAGENGGRVMYQGAPVASPWRDVPPIERTRLVVGDKTHRLTFQGASIHNLRDVACSIPLGRLTCLTGVSGSGKSSFVRGILVPAVAATLAQPSQLEDFEFRRGHWERVSGSEHLRGLVALDQKVPPPNRRSIVATFIEVADDLRSRLAASEGARAVGLSATDFGLNAGHGRCQYCLGVGEVEQQAHWTPCPVCGGTRFGEEALSVRVDGLNISDLLALPVSGLRARARALVTPYLPLLEAMVELGIGHLSLGRRVDTLSGGEVQRLRIARKLAEHGQGGLLFVLDEPAAGLHPRDVGLLVRALDRILDQGRNTVVLVEHNLDIVRAADWLVEFGPGSGPEGGQVVAEGTPDQLRQTKTATGLALAGRLKAISSHQGRSSPRAGRVGASAGSVEQASRAQAWIRQLMGDDVAIPEEPSEDAPPARPAVTLGERFWKGRLPWELGGLDEEVARLLLEVWADRTSPASSQDAFLRTWARRESARLVIHPFLKELQVWGRKLPRSAVDTAREHARAMGLELVDPDGGPLKKGANADWRQVRATGTRFVPRQAEGEERRRVLVDALSLGGGYVELRGPAWELLGTLQTRLLDLERGVVAPMKATSFHFSRHDVRGRCPLCRGTGEVLALSEELLIGNRRAAPEDETVLHPAAAAIMKGIRRSELLPFLKRMTEEGLWEKGVAFHRLNAEAHDLLMFGCWTRPGHGTFLKDAKADPQEVGSWLRWDGLHAHVQGQLERSTDAKWRDAVERSRSSRACPGCEGTGLGAVSTLLKLEERSWREWVRKGTASELCLALERLSPSSERQRRACQRLLQCLEPLTGGGHALREIADTSMLREVSRRVVQAFTDMPVLFG